MKDKIIVTRVLNELPEPSAEEVRGWMGQSVGKYHINQLNEMIENLKENWANGDYTGSNTEETIQLNSEAIGRVQQVAEILLTLEEMGIEDEETEENTD